MSLFKENTEVSPDLDGRLMQDILDQARQELFQFLQNDAILYEAFNFHSSPSVVTLFTIHDFDARFRPRLNESGEVEFVYFGNLNYNQIYILLLSQKNLPYKIYMRNGLEIRVKDHTKKII